MSESEQPGRYACIANNVVENVIVATAKFIESIKPEAMGADALVDVTGQRVSIGWTYDPDTQSFTEPEPAPEE